LLARPRELRRRAAPADGSMSEPEDGLENVFWLGGSPCAGKTSISEILSRRFELDVYHVDEAFETHIHGLEPARQPALTQWCRSSWNERWMQSIDSLVQNVIECYREHFALILKDILMMSKYKSLLIEDTALLPGQVAGHLPQQNCASWVIATAEFQREHYRKRKWAREIVEQCDNPDQAFYNWMERDVRFAEWVQVEVNALGLQLLKVDGSLTIKETAEAIAVQLQLRDK
jgi:2-phosphoglycerate kinase